MGNWRRVHILGKYGNSYFKGSVNITPVVDIHCVADYGSGECINRVRLHPSGKVEILPLLFKDIHKVGFFLGFTNFWKRFLLFWQ